MAMPNYVMSCFKLSVSTCKEMEREIARFWWMGNKKNSGMPWIAWEKLKKRKAGGGLGFKDLQCFNLVFLAGV
ncbi:hypothetical protein FF2_031633 [Malus domestica]